MNIRKFLIISCFALQFSTIMHASSQASYNTAFQAFDKAFGNTAGTNTLAQSAAFISSNAGSFAWSKTVAIANTLNSSPQAMAVGLFLAIGNPITVASHFTGADITKSGSTVGFDNLQAALTAAQGTTATTTTTPATTPATTTTTPATTTTTTTPTTTTTTTPTTTTTSTTTTPAATTTATPTATDTAAIALKAQIDSSLIIYNSYLTSVSQSQVKIIAAA